VPPPPIITKVHLPLIITKVKICAQWLDVAIALYNFGLILLLRNLIYVLGRKYQTLFFVD